MVIANKPTKSLKDCMDYVYCKLRVSEPVQDSDGKLRKVFNGISVNSWFSPMGISVCPEKEKPPYSPITKDLRTKLEERAKSASAVLGRKYFEIEQQEVGKDEILCGSSMFKSESNHKEQKQNKRHVKSASGRFCGNNCPSSSGEIRTRILAQRPHTCNGTRTDKVVYENLSISAKSLEIFKPEQKSEAEKITSTNEENVRLLSDFKTEHEMRNAYLSRVKSAPPMIQCYGSIGTESKKQTSIPLYWKTKSVYHRKQMTTGNIHNEKTTECVSRGSLWKPLLYSQDCGTKPKAGCPYKCKGCFRACLVSQDYMDKLINGKVQLNPPRKYSIRPKFYHRKIVEYAIANAQPIKELIEKERQEQSKVSIEDKIIE